MIKKIIIIIVIGILIGNDRQNQLENSIQCPCQKGLLSNHFSPNAKKLKDLISELRKDSIAIQNIQNLILTNYSPEKQDCLMNNIKKNINNKKISDEGIYSIIGECYGKDLIRGKDNVLIYIILFVIITIGVIFSTFFIIKNKTNKQ